LKTDTGSYIKEGIMNIFYLNCSCCLPHIKLHIYLESDTGQCKKNSHGAWRTSKYCEFVFQQDCHSAQETLLFWHKSFTR